MCIIFSFPWGSPSMGWGETPYKRSVEKFCFCFKLIISEGQRSILKDNYLEMEINSWPVLGKTFSSLRIWHRAIKPSIFCNEWGANSRINSCRSLSFITLKYVQLYIVREMLFFLSLGNYLYIRASESKDCDLFFWANIVITFYLWSLFLDVTSFTFGFW